MSVDIKGLQSSVRVMEEAPVIEGGTQGAHEEPPQVPIGGSQVSQVDVLFSSPNSNCHLWVFERALRPLWWFDTSPDRPLFQREGPP